MRRLFQSFERAGLDYLLISGQASILYGAATFSEDVDLWIRPSTLNAKRLLRALSASIARYHRLTPPLTLRNMWAGHGFHFRVPSGAAPIYLDVRAYPPRVGSFAEAKRRSIRMSTPWGRIPVVSLEDLVERKKTRRLADYDIIPNLVEVGLASVAEPDRELRRWAAHNAFRPELLVRLQGGSLESARRNILRRLSRLQRADTRYWSRILADLKRIRQAGGLLPEGERMERP